jgi:FkbM family methyltransferase
MTRRVPSRGAAAVVNGVLSRLGHDGGQACWRVAEGIDGHGAMELDVSSRFQRKMYLFPRAYWRRLLSLPFGRFMHRTLKAGQVFLDIGSNVGFYTMSAAELVGAGGQVVAFEPDPATFESLSRSVRRNGLGQVRCLNVALSDRAGEMPFFRTDGGTAHSLVPEAPGREKRYSGRVQVRVTTLDHLVQSGELVLPRIDLLKIDVEGEEGHTVKGMLQTLARAGHPPVWAEVRGPRGSTRAPDTYPVVAEALAALGYAPAFWNEDGTFRPVARGQVQGREDVIFRRPR